jgi:hypothetical protein
MYRMGSGVKMTQKKQTNTKVIYDRDFKKENKSVIFSTTLLKYYSKKTEMSIPDIEELFKAFGDIHTIQLLKKKIIEINSQ